MQSSAGRFLVRKVPPFGNNRPSSNHGKSKKKQNDANGICNNKMSFTIQRHNRKDQNEKPQSGKLYGNVDSWKGCKFVDGGTVALIRGINVQNKRTSTNKNKSQLWPQA
nr:hypothetical protein [Tanacetum cinerariifolium]GFB30843.1 hypothetical protein [Tanacetum cinerariifolium]